MKQRKGLFRELMHISNDTKAIWSDFLNPEVMHRRFVTAGLFIAAQEMLETAVKQRPLEFFSDRWTTSEGWKPSREYAEKVLALDPEGKFRRPAWFNPLA